MLCQGDHILHLKKAKGHTIIKCMILLYLEYFHFCAIGMEPSLFNQVCDTSYSDTLILDINKWPNKDCDNFKLVDDPLYFEEKLYIPKESAYLHILKVGLDFLATKHFWFNKSL